MRFEPKYKSPLIDPAFFILNMSGIYPDLSYWLPEPKDPWKTVGEVVSERKMYDSCDYYVSDNERHIYITRDVFRKMKNMKKPMELAIARWYSERANLIRYDDDGTLYRMKLDDHLTKESLQNIVDFTEGAKINQGYLTSWGCGEFRY